MTGTVGPASLSHSCSYISGCRWHSRHSRQPRVDKGQSVMHGSLSRLNRCLKVWLERRMMHGSLGKKKQRCTAAFMQQIASDCCIDRPTHEKQLNILTACIDSPTHEKQLNILTACMQHIKPNLAHDLVSCTQFSVWRVLDLQEEIILCLNKPKGSTDIELHMHIKHETWTR